jgi:hypothetical protein
VAIYGLRIRESVLGMYVEDEASTKVSSAANASRDCYIISAIVSAR